MVRELEGDRRVLVTHFWIGPPAEEGELRRVEAGLGGPLPAPIRAFYREASGIQLRWIDRESRYYREDDEPPRKERHAWDIQGDGDTANGVINLLPVGELLGEDDDDKRHIDDFSAHGSAALELQGGRLGTSVYLGVDHNADWEATRVDFTTYLEWILHVRGSVEARARHLRAPGSRGPAPLPPPGPGAPRVALDDLLPPRNPLLVAAPAGTRVRFEQTGSGREQRGVVLGRERAPARPPWGGRDFLRVRSDLGGETYVPLRAAAVAPRDAYEQAWAAPAAFLGSLVASSQAAGHRLLAEISWRERFRSRDEVFPVGLPGGIWLAIAVLERMEIAVVVPRLAAVARRWLREPAATLDAALPLAEMLAALLGRRLARQPSFRLDEDTSDELSLLVDDLQRGIARRPRGPWPETIAAPTSYLAAALAGAAAPLRDTPEQHDGREVGLDSISIFF
jgi:hypothetical protein